MTKFLNKNTNNTGSIGPQGFQGYPGNQGPQGLQGATGPQGAEGPQGVQGDAGPQGIQGDTGAQGSAGPQGIQGDTGPQGSDGPQGYPGTPGSQGAINIGTATAAGSVTTTSSTYVSLTGDPAVTVTTGTSAIVIITSDVINNTSNIGVISFSVSGATTLSADDTKAALVAVTSNTSGYTLTLQSSFYLNNLIAGSNIFTMKYKANPGGNPGPSFLNRKIVVLPQ